MTLIGDAAHLMTPFAGVGVNVAMEDALHLFESIHQRISTWLAPWEPSSVLPSDISLSGAIREYETEMFARAERYAKETWMYLGYFFHEQGGQPMIDHFTRKRIQDKIDRDEKEAYEALLKGVDEERIAVPKVEEKAEEKVKETEMKSGAIVIEESMILEPAVC